MNNKSLPDDLYAARQGIIQIIGDEQLKQRTAEFLPIVRLLCVEQNMTDVAAVEFILDNIETLDTEPELVKAMCAEILEPRDE